MSWLGDIRRLPSAIDCSSSAQALEGIGQICGPQAETAWAVYRRLWHVE